MIHVYASRGHSIGYGGNSEERSGTYGSKLPCTSSCSDADDPAKSNYIDTILQRLRMKPNDGTGQLARAA